MDLDGIPKTYGINSLFLIPLRKTEHFESRISFGLKLCKMPDIYRTPNRVISFEMFFNKGADLRHSYSCICFQSSRTKTEKVGWKIQNDKGLYDPDNNSLLFSRNVKNFVRRGRIRNLER